MALKVKIKSIKKGKIVIYSDVGQTDAYKKVWEKCGLCFAH